MVSARDNARSVLHKTETLLQNEQALMDAQAAPAAPALADEQAAAGVSAEAATQDLAAVQAAAAAAAEAAWRLLQREREAAACAAEAACTRRNEEVARKDAAISGLKQGFLTKEATLLDEIQRLRRERNGVEVYDVDTGVSEVVERNDTELPATRVRQEQAVTTSVSQVLQKRLVEVKKEKVAVLSDMSDALECIICMEQTQDIALSCGHCYCSSCSLTMDVCPTCSKAVTTRIKLFGAVQTLSDMVVPP